MFSCSLSLGATSPGDLLSVSGHGQIRGVDHVHQRLPLVLFQLVSTLTFKHATYLLFENGKEGMCLLVTTSLTYISKCSQSHGKPLGVRKSVWSVVLVRRIRCLDSTDVTPDARHPMESPLNCL